MGEGTKVILISFDSTLRSNLSVGMPIDLLMYERDSLEISYQRRIGANDPYFEKLSKGWSGALREAFKNIDNYRDPTIGDQDTQTHLPLDPPAAK
jgi:putative proteasome-type protease